MCMCVRVVCVRECVRVSVSVYHILGMYIITYWACTYIYINSYRICTYKHISFSIQYLQHTHKPFNIYKTHKPMYAAVINSGTCEQINVSVGLF